MAETLWRSEEAASATEGVLQGAAWSASSLSIDTRSLKPGALFVALKGERSDGHAHLAAAAREGAVAALVDHVPAETGGLALLVVKDTLKALEMLAAAARKRSLAKIIAITGSVGKTSAKEALALALSAYGTVYATRGNYNNHIGLPLTLAALPPQANYAVLEMGMNHANEIAPLSMLAKPDVALVTNVDAVHAEFFDSIEDIARAKAEIFAGLGGVAVLPVDSSYFAILAEEADRQGVFVTGFGAADTADVRLLESDANRKETKLRFSVGPAEYTASVRALGAHWAHSVLGVLACVEVLGLDLAPAIGKLAAFKEPEGRGRLNEVSVQGVRVSLLDDSYNASPVSMRGAIDKLGMLARSTPPRRSVAVLGQMLELGEQGAVKHTELSAVLQAAKIDKVFACGPLMAPMFRALPIAMQGKYAFSAEELRPTLEHALQEGDLVLIKGSHGSKAYTIAEAWQNKHTEYESVHAHSQKARPNAV